MRETPVSSIASPHFLRLHDLRDPDFARSKLSYKGRTSRRLCKILIFPLHYQHEERGKVGIQKDFQNSNGSQLLRTYPLVCLLNAQRKS